MTTERIHDWESYCEAHGLDPVEELKRRREEDYRRMRVILYLAAALVVGCGLAGWVAYRLIGG